MKKKNNFFGRKNKQAQAKEEFDENMKAILSEASDISNHLKSIGINPDMVHAVCVASDDSGNQKAYSVNLSDLTVKPRELSEEELDLLSGNAEEDGSLIDSACDSDQTTMQVIKKSTGDERCFPLTMSEVSLFRNLRS